MGWIDKAHKYEKKEFAQRLCQLFDQAETTTWLFRSTAEKLSDWLRHLVMAVWGYLAESVGTGI